jgi:KipI family sensor histidine kinase inhibitor
VFLAIKYKIAGDTGIVIEFKNEISEEVNSKVRSFCIAVEKSSLNGVEDIVPTYRSLLICYNPCKVRGDILIEKLKEIENHIEEIDIPEPRLIEIPTIYGGKYGPDLDFVAEYNNISADKVIEYHTQKKYLIYMLGFTPGFPYLGGMSEKIAAPRLDNPRTCIPAGSVGIAGNQTGIYPIESPGGWRLIGRTPLDLFDPNKKPYFLLKAGDYLKFTAINENEYNSKNLLQRGC